MVGNRRLVRAALSAALLALTACSGAASSTPGGAAPLRDGPLQATSAHSWGFRQPVGAAFTDGLETLEFSGSEPAKLVKVRLLGDPALRLLGVALATPDRRYGSQQLFEGFPPRDRSLPRGVLLPDPYGKPLSPQTRFDIGWELLLGIRVDEPGRHVRTGIEVTYTVGAETFVEVIPAALAVCADPDAVKQVNDCELPPLPGAD